MRVPSFMTALLAGAALLLVCANGCGGDDGPAASADAASSDSTPPSDESSADTVDPGACAIAEGAETPDYLEALRCASDFDALASAPLDTSLPGARSVKVVFDRDGGDRLYFQNSQKYLIHHDFAADHLSGGGLPIVPSLATFNQSEYFAPDRRFILGAVTYYEGPDVWALELAPYDTASAEMMATLYEAIAGAAFFGEALVFHPSSEALTAEAAKLPATVPLVTTDALYAGIDYQPLNLATAVGRLRFATVESLTTEYVSFREIVVLDAIPNDISVVAGIVTETFQTPLSHINVLSQNRHTPNMALRGAMTDPTLRALEGEWVRLTVGATTWSIEAVSLEDAELWWEANRPTTVTLPTPDLTVTDLRDIEEVTVQDEATPLRDALVEAVRAFGGKAAHYSVLARMPELASMRKAFAVPAYYYVQFMTDNGFFDRLRAFAEDAEFQSDPAVKDAALAQFRADMVKAPIDADFQRALKLKLTLEYPGLTMRFRSSTNSEDLDGFPCAGCYESHTGDPADWPDVLTAIRETWSSAFSYRTYEEREYYGVDHTTVTMPLLVHHNFPDESANGVALTANPYDSAGTQPGFYINVQYGGDSEVVHPGSEETTDTLVYLFDEPGQPAIYLTHSNLVPDGGTVLTTAQLYQLGVALDAIHARFSPAYGPLGGNTGWYAMDVEFKYEAPAEGEDAILIIKQARPNPGRGE